MRVFGKKSILISLELDKWFLYIFFTVLPPCEFILNYMFWIQAINITNV
jgi:hypothetical protein